MNKKGYLQISFSWMFAIIVGAFILFLAVYGATKLIKSEEKIQDAKIGKEIGILTNPLETGFETGKTTSLTLPVETRIYNLCKEDSSFGKQIIKVAQQSFGKWTETNFNIEFANKYIFSESYVEGEKFNLFSKPLELPFKVTDLIYITSASKKYCFIGAPENIQEEISALKQQNFLLTNCTEQDIKVCFQGGTDCEIRVNYGASYVSKDSETLYFTGDPFMYAAILSDKETYECQVKRVMQRLSHLALVYKDKALFISRTGCNSNINSELLTLSSIAKRMSDSQSLGNIGLIAEDIKDKHSYEDCKLW